MSGIGVILAVSAMIGCTVVANLLLKLGATTPADERIVFGIVDWKVLAGLVAFGCSAVIYAALLESVPLNVAQSFAAAQFVAVIVASNQLLNEPIPGLRWAGILLISAGIFLTGMTVK
jgi:drug/metabolite transporter (DMT)-like permease